MCTSSFLHILSFLSSFSHAEDFLRGTCRSKSALSSQTCPELPGYECEQVQGMHFKTEVDVLIPSSLGIWISGTAFAQSGRVANYQEKE